MTAADKPLCALPGCDLTVLTWLDPDYCSDPHRREHRAVPAAEVEAPAITRFLRSLEVISPDERAYVDTSAAPIVLTTSVQVRPLTVWERVVLWLRGRR